ncbi:MAG: TonB family protein [Burkholderiaceae bacterium]
MSMLAPPNASRIQPPVALVNAWALCIALGLHGAALFWIWLEIGQVDLQASSSRPMMASIIAPYQESPAVRPPPSAVRRSERQDTERIIAAESATPAPVVHREERPRDQAAAVPDADRTETVAPSVTSAEMTQPQFDATYLNNPKPAYPVMSRRLGEEGQVLLRVLVSPQGRPEQIQLLSGSGFARLDEAAQEAVAKWRFVPAKVGSVATTAWVQVPVSFQLRR